MKTKIEVITGFLEWGKTTFINSVIKQEILNEESNIVIITCEEGIEQIDTFKKENVIVKHMGKEELNYEYFKNIQDEYDPEYIFLEYNGMWNIDELFKINFKRKFKIDRIIGVVNPASFNTYLNNMYEIIAEHISNCDMIFINNYENCLKENVDKVSNIIRKINRKCVITSEDEEKNEYMKEIINYDDAVKKENVIYIFMLCTLFWIIFLYISVIRRDGMPEIVKIEKFCGIFVSILIETVPFIIIGSFISSIMQIFISDEKIAGLFNRKGISGYLAACFIGVIIPICDCSMMIITRRLIKKGVSIPKAITFLLAAPAVNPIVIISTYYAFSCSSYVMFFRILFSILIAVTAGIAADKICAKDDHNVLNDNFKMNYGNSSLGITKINFKGNIGKIEAVLKHTANEFFYTSKYIILGAAFSSFIQTIVPRSIFSNIKGTVFVQIIIMILISFFMSVCANSNAFIARSFSNLFSTSSLICFMVMGPMLDIKNLIMMSSSFKNSFIVKLVIILLVISLFVFVPFGIITKTGV